MSRNPPWSTDELILALSLYFHRGLLSPHDPAVVELSEELNSLPLDMDSAKGETFRNLNGVVMKLANFAALDDNYGGAGLRRGGRRDAQLFNAYKDRRDDCHAMAEAIKRGLGDGSLPDVYTADDDEVVEGRLLVKAHRLRERNRSIVKRRKMAMRRKLGQLQCEVCGLTERECAGRFGESARDVFECHHTVPLHGLDGSRTTRESDLAVLCPTCHAAIHKFTPPVSVERLGEIVAGGAAQAQSDKGAL